MPHWKTILTYDGTPYNGWQIQPNLPTIQGTLAQAIHRVTGESVLPQGSGRTDTGVHALGQVATFTLTVPIPATNLHRALNRALPSSIRVLSVEPVPENFHARHSARRKTYEYRILPNDQICSPMRAPFVWASHIPLDLTHLQQAAAHIIGTHDFTSFAASDPDLTTRLRTQSDKSQPIKEVVISTEGGAFPAAVESPPHFFPSADTAIVPTDNTRTIFHSDWHQQEDIFIYRVTGSGFLHHMVRNLVGTFVDPTFVPDEIPTILAARNRSAAGPTAPARGLFLVEVEY
ncbi:tRNA pseudouridine synthase A [Tunturiibacter lichenicola]|uniref:tRNA pseudouridine synthase A n=1 Tax=Tunturiibacter lichenicola TaxID=2051959 RepID=UPI003D9AE718